MRHLPLTAAALALATQAHAANVSGVYAFSWDEACQAVQNVTSSPTNGTNLESIDPGGIHQQIGYATITPTKAGGLSGTISIVASSNDDSLLVTGLPGPPVQPPVHNMANTPANKSAPLTGTYVLTLASGAPATLVITPSGGSALTFSVALSNLAGGVYHGFKALTLETGNSGTEACSVILTGEHQ